ncbi:MAG TPA: hypothetical protein DIC52_24645 [Candidatus Latescibacteria bacterium]|nr:hypothetical protein [Candidatus Latescibacterota bacterium]
MAAGLDIAAVVVTEQVLRASHTKEVEVHVAVNAVVTPSAWDYLRFHRLRLTRSASGAGRSDTNKAVPTADPTSITEVLPPGSEAGVLSRGRCDHPDQAYGCQTEEFGSGFVQPAACSECAIKQAQQTGRTNCGCGGCNKEVTDDGVDALVQQLTDEIMKRLGTG